jgi:hypothetical protein
MTLKAYYDNIRAKTGKTPQDFRVLAEKKGLLKPGVKTGEIVAWLKKDFGLGRGHAMAIVLSFQQAVGPKVSKGDRISKLFSGPRSRWREPYEELLGKMRQFGSDVSVSPTDTYISVLRKGKKFSVLQVTSDRMDIGIKLKGTRSTGRFEKAGVWNPMVTHRVRVEDPRQIDAEVISWLHQAYDKA